MIGRWSLGRGVGSARAPRTPAAAPAPPAAAASAASAAAAAAAAASAASLAAAVAAACRPFEPAAAFLAAEGRSGGLDARSGGGGGGDVEPGAVVGTAAARGGATAPPQACRRAGSAVDAGSPPGGSAFAGARSAQFRHSVAASPTSFSSRGSRPSSGASAARSGRDATSLAAFAPDADAAARYEALTRAVLSVAEAPAQEAWDRLAPTRHFTGELLVAALWAVHQLDVEYRRWARGVQEADAGGGGRGRTLSCSSYVEEDGALKTAFECACALLNRVQTVFRLVGSPTRAARLGDLMLDMGRRFYRGMWTAKTAGHRLTGSRLDEVWDLLTEALDAWRAGTPSLVFPPENCAADAGGGARCAGCFAGDSCRSCSRIIGEPKNSCARVLSGLMGCFDCFVR